jgi:hypothetical protein
VSEDPASNSSNIEINDNAAVRDAETSSVVPENTHSSFGVSPVNIPLDQIRVIENINALISEVGFVLLKTRSLIYNDHLTLLITVWRISFFIDPASISLI